MEEDKNLVLYNPNISNMPMLKMNRETAEEQLAPNRNILDIEQDVMEHRARNRLMKETGHYEDIDFHRQGIKDPYEKMVFVRGHKGLNKKLKKEDKLHKKLSKMTIEDEMMYEKAAEEKRMMYKKAPIQRRVRKLKDEVLEVPVERRVRKIKDEVLEVPVEKRIRKFKELQPVEQVMELSVGHKKDIKTHKKVPTDMIERMAWVRAHKSLNKKQKTEDKKHKTLSKK